MIDEVESLVFDPRDFFSSTHETTLMDKDALAPYVLIALFSLVFIVIIAMYRKDNKREKRIKEHGRTVTGWVVQANSDAFEGNFVDAPAQIIVSFEEDTPELQELMAEVRGLMVDLLERDPTNEDEQSVCNIVRDQRVDDHKRDIVPKSLTHGRSVYVMQTYIKERFLPKGKLELNYVMCQAVPGDNEGGAIMIRYLDDPKSKIKA